MKLVSLLALPFAFSLFSSEAGALDHSDLDLLGRWIADQQYTTPGLPSDGGIKIGPGPAAVGTDGTRYWRVSPYDANLAVLGMLRTKAPDHVRVAERWIDWYFAHLNSHDAPDGVPDEHFYHADGRGETACVKPGDHFLCHYNDATDSAAATFFSDLWAAHEAGVLDASLCTPERKRLVAALAGTLLQLQQPDGLCWAKRDYRVKYLEDNCEVFRGLIDLARLEKTVFNNHEEATRDRQAAERVRQAIVGELYDQPTRLFKIARFEDNHSQRADLDKWYPDSQAQLWPILFGVLAPTDANARAVISAINGHWNGELKPDWASAPKQINNGSIEAGDAYAMLLGGDTARVRTFAQRVKRLEFPGSNGSHGFEWPFDVADAGWLLQIFNQLDN